MKTTWKILWVEDNYPEIKAKMTPLVKAGWEIIPCTNSRDAERILSSGEHFDCFLIDLKLPVIGPEVVEDRIADNDDRYVGVGLIRLIRKLVGFRVPIIVYSVVHDPEVDKLLDDLQVAKRFPKGPNTSSKEVCDAIKQMVDVAV